MFDFRYEAVINLPRNGREREEEIERGKVKERRTELALPASFPRFSVVTQTQRNFIALTGER